MEGDGSVIRSFAKPHSILVHEGDVIIIINSAKHWTVILIDYSSVCKGDVDQGITKAFVFTLLVLIGVAAVYHIRSKAAQEVSLSASKTLTIKVLRLVVLMAFAAITILITSLTSFVNKGASVTVIVFDILVALFILAGHSQLSNISRSQSLSD